jgi:FMN phosphatase YigB (HAD superfamily)
MWQNCPGLSRIGPREVVGVFKAVLFDLDGTLLHVDTRQLMQAYVQSLAQWFEDVVPPDRFMRCLLAASQAMVENRDPERTNEQVFGGTFFPAIGISEAAMAPRVAEYYARAFPQLRVWASPDPDARRAVTAVLNRGLAAVVATNPIFPRAAIMQRLEWAGIADLPFAHVTTLETSHFCKPHPEYFLEIADTIQAHPQECMMVGNDAQLDIVAQRVGMRTYLVTNHLIARGEIPAPADHTGTLAELAEFLSVPRIAPL